LPKPKPKKLQNKKKTPISELDSLIFFFTTLPSRQASIHIYMCVCVCAHEKITGGPADDVDTLNNTGV
jgi:hypothetical protein